MLLALVLAVLLALQPVQARPAPPPDAPVEAFVSEAAEAGQADTLMLHNLLTGEQSSESVSGNRYSIVGPQVVFFNESSGRVLAVGADGQTSEHPLIQPSAGARRIDWTYSPEAGLVAWTVTEGSPDALSTATYIASPQGAGARLVLRDGPRAGIRAFPIAFSEDGGTLFMDYQPDTIADIAPLRQYAAMFALDLATGGASSLPGEASCYCGGGVGAGQFVRLALASAGFDVRVYDLNRGLSQVIPSLGLAEYTQAGDLTISPDGSKAVYTLLQLIPDGQPGELRAIYAVVDLINGTQRALNAEDPDERLLRPAAWTEDGRALLMNDPAEPGTWRLDVATGDLRRAASANYIGSTVSPSSLR
ncbi:MAG: hypothetical protein JNL34_02845 [Anaerolineae bacterium]|nr:hypothetical protein [Anaerolineae bacterium]